MTVRQNTAEVARLLKEVHAHPMCARFENTGTHYRAYCPEGFLFGAIQACHLEAGKIKALGNLLDAMERHWKGAAL